MSADTKLVKAKDNESGTITATLAPSTTTSMNLTPVPANAPGFIDLEPGTTNEEVIYYQSSNPGAGTVSGLIRDYTNLNGGVGRNHNNGASWVTQQLAEYVNNLVNAVLEGYIQEQNTVAFVDTTHFTVNTDQTAIYTAGRLLRYNQNNTHVDIVVSSSYNSGTGLTTVTTTGTVQNPTTTVEYAIQPKSQTNAYAASTAVQSGQYLYAADTGAANAFAVTLSPVPAAYTVGMVVRFKAANATTGAATLNVNSLGAKTIKKLDGATDLAANDIKAGQTVAVIYDGTNFQLLSPIANVSALSSKLLTTTRDLTAASGDVAYTGVGFQPTAIIVIGNVDANANLAVWGMVDSAKNSDALERDGSLSEYLSNTGRFIGFDTAVGASQNAILKTFDVDGFTLTWTKIGSPTGTGKLMFLCFK